MATGASWQQYYSPAGSASTGAGKYTTGTSTMSYQSGITLEYTQDLHLKMSKKIAQLTKVSRDCPRLQRESHGYVMNGSPCSQAHRYSSRDGDAVAPAHVSANEVHDIGRGNALFPKTVPVQ